MRERRNKNLRGTPIVVSSSIVVPGLCLDKVFTCTESQHLFDSVFHFFITHEFCEGQKSKMETLFFLLKY